MLLLARANVIKLQGGVLLYEFSLNCRVESLHEKRKVLLNGIMSTKRNVKRKNVKRKYNERQEKVELEEKVKNVKRKL